MPKKDARTLVARFNEQIEPIYVLLRETENINLSHDLLEPEPSEIPALKQRSVNLIHCTLRCFFIPKLTSYFEPIKEILLSISFSTYQL